MTLRCRIVRLLPGTVHRCGCLRRSGSPPSPRVICLTPRPLHAHDAQPRNGQAMTHLPGRLLPLNLPDRPADLRETPLPELCSEFLGRIDDGAFSTEKAIRIGCAIG